MKYLAKYFQMMKILSPISLEIFIGATQLFDFYLYCVYDFFAKSSKADTKLMSTNLRSTLKRIKQQLFEGSNTNNLEQTNSLKIWVKVPLLCPMVNISSPDDLYGISHKACSVESLMFLAEAMKSVKPFIKQLLHTKDHPAYKNFYEQSVDVCEELGQLVFDCASDLFINVRGFRNDSELAFSFLK